jgi:hypothetical protein
VPSEISLVRPSESEGNPPERHLEPKSQVFQGHDGAQPHQDHQQSVFYKVLAFLFTPKAREAKPESGRGRSEEKECL